MVKFSRFIFTYTIVFRLDKITLYCGNRMRLILTRNWIINVGTYNLDFARQNDARLVVYSADTHDTGSNRYSGVIQFINVKVIFLNETQEFSFRFVKLFACSIIYLISNSKRNVNFLDYMRSISRI